MRSLYLGNLKRIEETQTKKEEEKPKPKKKKAKKVGGIASKLNMNMGAMRPGATPPKRKKTKKLGMAMKLNLNVGALRPGAAPPKKLRTASEPIIQEPITIKRATFMEKRRRRHTAADKKSALLELDS